MNQKALMIGACLTAIGSAACGPTDVEDADDNKSYFVDGYVEESTPAPATGEAHCNYGMAASAGAAGVGTNQIVPMTHSWEGFRPGEAEASMINVTEFYDCMGSLGIDAIVFDTSQYG